GKESRRTIPRHLWEIHQSLHADRPLGGSSGAAAGISRRDRRLVRSPLPRLSRRSASARDLGGFPDHGTGNLFDVSAAEKLDAALRSEEHTSELQSRGHLVCRLLLEKKKR